jgi:hypothetical protein
MCSLQSEGGMYFQLLLSATQAGITLIIKRGEGVVGKAGSAIVYMLGTNVSCCMHLGTHDNKLSYMENKTGEQLYRGRNVIFVPCSRYGAKKAVGLLPVVLQRSQGLLQGSTVSAQVVL